MYIYTYMMSVSEHLVFCHVHWKLCKGVNDTEVEPVKGQLIKASTSDSYV